MSGKKSHYVVDSIEITPSMIDAGVSEFFGFDMHFDPPAIVVELSWTLANFRCSETALYRYF
jgi:hypothetical protein